MTTSHLLPRVDPVHCRWCGCAIWRQNAPVVIEADTSPIRSATEELTFRLWGRMTYHVHKVGNGFELVPRFKANMTGDYTTRIVLPDHRCTHLPTATHPNYWPTRQETTHALPPY